MATAKDYQKTIADLKRQLADAHKDYVKTSALFSSIGEGVIVTDEYGNIEQVNDLCVQILGYTRNELLGKHFLKTVKAVNEDGSPVEPLDRPITRAFLNGSPVAERAYYITKGDVIVPVEINVSPFMFNGIPSGSVEVFRDLTDYYIKEAIQSEFISLASHQLRTPLSSINYLCPNAI
ncbi:MAG: PAS domain-containing protein [Candidatus Saccharibacteria bacterium]